MPLSCPFDSIQNYNSLYDLRNFGQNLSNCQKFILFLFHFLSINFIKIILERKYSIMQLIDTYILAQRAGGQTIGSNTHAVTAVPNKEIDWIRAFPRGPAFASRV